MYCTVKLQNKIYIKKHELEELKLKFKGELDAPLHL